jgi:peptide-methionine (S)-S-oxide reductase
VISYNELLTVFWQSHSPTYESYSDQYKSIIFYHNEEQKKLAEESMQQQEASVKQKIYTEIRPFNRFYLAEDYHQKYYLKMHPQFLEEFRLKYPEDADMTNSTAVAKVNGYLGGYGQLEDLEKQIHNLGLSLSAEKSLLEIGRDRLNKNGALCPTP